MPEDYDKTSQSPPLKSQPAEGLPEGRADMSVDSSDSTTSPTPLTPTGVFAPAGKEASPQVPAPAAQVSGSYSFKKAFFLSLFLGIFGMDKFYLGYKQLGKIKAATLGGLLLWAYIDAALILFGSTKAADGSALSGRKENFKFALGAFAGATLLVLVLLFAVLPMYIWSY